MIQIRVCLLAINHTNIHIHTYVCIHMGKKDTYTHTYRRKITKCYSLFLNMDLP